MFTLQTLRRADLISLAHPPLDGFIEIAFAMHTDLRS
jgi:hypothetical protein